MYNYKLCDYVPEPKPVSSPYTIACHYYPGWKRGGADLHNGFEDLKPYPDRTPLLGYYDEADPMTADWQIKWAVEHGINCFIYCWYRRPENVGHPVTRDALRFGHAIHDALFHARYRDYMKFTIMWECSERKGAASSIEDMTDNLLPFWVENYFSKPNYMTIDGKPVVYIYAVDTLIARLGGEDVLREGMARCNEKIRAMGYPGIHFSCMVNGWSKQNIEYFFANHRWNCDDVEKYIPLGFDSAFQYNWHFIGKYLTDEQTADYERTGRIPDDIVVKYQLDLMELFSKSRPEFFTLTASVMWDRNPWIKVMDIKESTLRMLPHYRLDPESWKRLLLGMRKIIETLPADAIGRKIVMLDNWNEWSEGHYLCPNAGYGFAHLQAVREVLTSFDNLPDYRLPQTLGIPCETHEYQPE